MARYQSAAIRGPVYLVVVNDDGVAVAGQGDIQLDVSHAHLESQIKSRQRIFRRVGRGTPVGDNHHGCGHMIPNTLACVMRDTRALTGEAYQVLIRSVARPDVGSSPPNRPGSGPRGRRSRKIRYRRLIRTSAVTAAKRREAI